MARRKVSKRTTKRSVKRTVKRSAKAQSMNNKSSNIQKLEKDFLTAPAKLAAHVANEIKAHKKKDAKSKNVLNKIKAKLEKAEKRISKAKDNKQVKAASKVHQKISKLHDAADKHYETTSHHLNELEDKHAKYVSLNKHIAQFLKDWAKDDKKSNNNKKSNPQAKKSKSQPSHESEQSHFHDFEITANENLISEEPSGLTS